MAGPVGPQGPQGSPGISGYQRVVGPAVLIGASSQAQSIATCPAGKKVLGGGFFTTSALALSYRSYPETDTTWRVELKNLEGVYHGHHIQAYAVCAFVQ